MFAAKDNFLKSGIIEIPSVIISVKYTTISFEPGKSPKEIPVFVA